MEFKTLILKDLQIGGITIKNVPVKPRYTAPGITYGTRDKIERLLSIAKKEKIMEIDFSRKE